MKKILIRPMDNQTGKGYGVMKPMGLSLLLIAAGISNSLAEQAVTGKIVIDDVIYDDSNSQTIRGSGVMGQENRQVGEFSSVVVDGSVELHYQRSSKAYVKVSGDQNLIPIITTTNKNGVLLINSTRSYQPLLPLLVEVGSPTLKALTLEGSGDTQLKDMDGSDFRLDLNGSGHVSLQGKVDRVSLNIDGSGDVNAKNMTSQTTEIKITGSGDITTTTRRSLNASITGSGNVSYYGHPGQVVKDVTGSGDISPGD
jgi:hypothetical protein